MEEVLHVPARKSAVLRDLTHTVLKEEGDSSLCWTYIHKSTISSLCLDPRRYLVVFTKQLHAHHSEDEDDDGEDERQVTQSAHGVTDDLDERVEGRPGAGELKYTKLKNKERHRKRQNFRIRAPDVLRSQNDLNSDLAIS